MAREPIGRALGLGNLVTHRVGYHRCMAQAAQIEPSRPLPIAVGEAVRMSVRTTAVDAVGLEERAASLAKRSIKRDAKLWALDLAIRSMDLTTLEGSDTVGKIVAICAKAVRPNPLDHSIPPVAAVCLYPQLVPVALEQLEGTGREGRERGRRVPERPRAR